MQKRIKYFSYHGIDNGCQKRVNSPAADSKVDYIIDSLNRIGFGVDHISFAPSSIRKSLPGFFDEQGDNTYRWFASIRKIDGPFRIFGRWIMELQFFIWCLCNIKFNEQVLVYHSLGYDSIFILLQRLKKIRIIGEIEEIYQDVTKQKTNQEKNEYEFIRICNKYLFPTESLDKLFNRDKKPSSIIYGIYTKEVVAEEKINDGKIHVVYGGTLDPHKGGAITAVQSAKYLSNKFHLHICGFGDSHLLEEEISRISKISEAKITFEGELLGANYKHFIQKCHVGLSTQNPDAAFNATSFPSKILVYLANGLNVVSVRIPVVENSSLSPYITYYNAQNPVDIAKAIRKASEVSFEVNDVLNKLDSDFRKELNSLIDS